MTTALQHRREGRSELRRESSSKHRRRWICRSGERLEVERGRKLSERRNEEGEGRERTLGVSTDWNEHATRFGELGRARHNEERRVRKLRGERVDFRERSETHLLEKI